MFLEKTSDINLQRAVKIFWWYVAFALIMSFAPYFKLPYRVFIPLTVFALAPMTIFSYIVMLGFREVAQQYALKWLRLLVLVHFFIFNILGIIGAVEMFFIYQPGVSESTILQDITVYSLAISTIIYGYLLGQLPSSFGKLPYWARVSNIGSGLLLPLPIIGRMEGIATNLPIIILSLLGLVGGFIFLILSMVIDYKILKRSAALYANPSLTNIPDRKEIVLSPVGLRGWLLLIIVQMAAGILGNANAIYRNFSILRQNIPLFDASLPNYVKNFDTFVYLETFLSSILFIGSLLSAYMFFKKKKIFPKFYICLQIFALFVVAFELIFPSFLGFASAETRRIMMASFASQRPILLGAVIGAAIWIPYFLKSKRVKATFIQ